MYQNCTSAPRSSCCPPEGCHFQRMCSVLREIAQKLWMMCVIFLSVSQWLHDVSILLYFNYYYNLRTGAGTSEQLKHWEYCHAKHCQGVFFPSPACYLSLHILLWKANSCGPCSSAGDPCVSSQYHHPVWHERGCLLWKKRWATWSSLEIANRRATHQSPSDFSYKSALFNFFQISYGLA